MKIFFSALNCLMLAANTSFAADAIDLERAMDLAEKHSPQARIATAAREEAESRTLQIAGGLGPRVDVDGSRVWFNKDTNKLVGIAPELPERSTTAGITVSQPIISLAPMFMNVRAHAKLSKISKNQEQQAAYAARIDGANAYIGIIQSQQLLQVANSSYLAVERQNKDAQAQSRVGRLSASDAMRFELALTDARLQQTLANNTLQNARQFAIEVFGVNLEQLNLSNLTQSIWEERKPPIPKLEEGVKEALIARTEIQNSRDQVDVAELARNAARSDFFPTLNAFMKYQRNFEAKDISLGTGADASAFKKKDVQDTMTYGLQLSWNIWDWGSKFNRISEYSAGVMKAQAAQDAAVSQVTIEATRATLDLHSAIESLESSKAAVKLSEEVFRLMDIRFKGGQVSTTDVIQAERDQTRARGNLVTARGNVDLAWLKFLQAMGRKPTIRQL